MYALCIIALLLSLVQQNRHNPITKPDNTQKPYADSSDKQSSSSEHGISAHYEIHQQPENTQQQKQSDEFDRKFQHWYWGATILGVVISIGLFCALIHQNKLTRKAANAAEASANAIRNSERAWILIKIESNDYVYFTVYGNTPAKILRRAVDRAVISSFDELNPIPKYDFSNSPPSTILVKGDEKKVIHDFSATWKLQPSPWDKIRSGEMILFIYGTVEYLDVVNESNIHETRFGYRWDNKIHNFVLDGPSEYNKVT